MKKRHKIAPLITAVLAVILMLSLSSCQNTEEPPSPTGESVTLIDMYTTAKCVVVYRGGDDPAHSAALDFSKLIKEEGMRLAYDFAMSDDLSTSESEIIFGEADREACRAAADYLKRRMSATPYDLHCVFYYLDGRLSIVANSYRAYQMAIDVFMSKYCSGGRISVPDNLCEHVTMSPEDYDDKRFEQIMDEHKLKKAEHKAALPSLLAKLEAQRGELAESGFFGSSTADIGKSSWGTAPTLPGGDHPRLLLNPDTLTEVKRAFTRDDNTNTRLFGIFDDEIPADCVLPEASKKGTNTTVGIDNIHNYNETYLEIIQAKALAYLLYDDPYYGYQAIYYIKNYLKSLDIVQMGSDQCRQYGSVMYTAAIVYDWCYGLLTDLDKEQLIAGVENRICRYKNKSGRAMEVGFPPKGQGSVVGHGAEKQILRDYLSFSVAIYDENPSWWSYVAARVYNDFVPSRNHYYQSGTVSQGTGYTTTRYVSDLFSAWILKAATGKSPYSGMANATKGLLGYEFAPGRLFNDGDGTGDEVKSSGFLHVVMITAYLEKDPTLMAQANYLYGNSMFTNSFHALTSATYAALRGMSTPTPTESRYDGMPLIQYNGSPLGQYVLREAWADASSAAVMMRIKERTTANHEHCDAGTFEIYYKGMLTSDGGCYNNYNHDHTQYFHQATVSHNGLLIYNPSLAKTQHGWYSGGQRKLGEPYNFEAWMGSEFNTGRVIGREHGYKGGDESKPLYAYVAGDITAAYDAKTVDYVGRRMLTVFTGREDFPLAFFVYDDVSSDDASFEKRFLLQISSPEEPIINGRTGTVTTTNLNGKLILTCLSDGVSLNGVGGRSEGSYNASKSSNYMINGKQLVPMSTSADDYHWGRVEILSVNQSKNATFLNLITVTDADNSDTPSCLATESNVGLEGAVFEGSIVALFATDRERASSEISCTTRGKGSMDYYVSGVAAGIWTVTVNGKGIGSFTATEEGGLLTFTAPAGNVVISPAK